MFLESVSLNIAQFNWELAGKSKLEIKLMKLHIVLRRFALNLMNGNIHFISPAQLLYRIYLHPFDKKKYCNLNSSSIAHTAGNINDFAYYVFSLFPEWKNVYAFVEEKNIYISDLKSSLLKSSIIL